MKEYIEERAIEIAYYIIENKATVRQTAKMFGVSKSTIHVVVTKQNGLCGELNKDYNKWVTALCRVVTHSFCRLFVFRRISD